MSRCVPHDHQGDWGHIWRSWTHLEDDVSLGPRPGVVSPVPRPGVVFLRSIP